MGRSRRRRALLIYVAGLFGGALTMACITYAVGALLPVEIPVAVRVAGALIVALWGVRVASGRGLPFPSSPWQVPEIWLLTLPRNLTAGLYGYLLGLGMLTSVVLPVYWCFLVGSLFSPSLGISIIVWSAYAATRASMTAIGVFRHFERTRDDAVPRSTPSNWESARFGASLALLALSMYLLVGL